MDCSRILDMFSIVNITINNETEQGLWLKEDDTSLFDAKYWNIWLLIGEICCIITAALIPILFICCYYPKLDVKMKIRKLKSFDLYYNYFHDDILKHLKPYLQQNGEANTDIII